ncbi:MAG: type 4a pilus biogenesis protein PilO [Luminiphilus sp.]
MSILDQIRALNEVDLANLDFENVGSWPGPLRVLLAILLFVLLATGGYFYHLDGLNQRFAAEQAKEVELRREFERKSFEAANLDAYRVQMQEMQESFGALVSQLPSDTEVPGLLEDISAKGQQNGMSIENIDLLDEVTEEFYVELPIAITATGSYHSLGAFVSGMASLPRIVTLHDFDIEMDGDDSDQLVMEITAKTYRYRDGANDG